MGITRFQLPTKSAESTERALLRRAPGLKPGMPSREVAEAIAAVKRYFKGAGTDFSGFKLYLGEPDSFFERIYEAARWIGWATQRPMALWQRNSAPGPGAARDVGQAMAINPVALIIRCHRLLAASGKLGGGSAPGGSAAKRRMLALEGFTSIRRHRRSNLLGFEAGKRLGRPVPR